MMPHKDLYVMLRAIIIVCLFLLVHNGLAQQIVTDRPDQTESSSIVDKGSLQIESGLLLGFSEVEDISFKTIIAPTTLFRLGIVSGLELRIVNQYEKNKITNTAIKNEGISDIEIGVKLGIMQKDNYKTKMALITHLLIPTGTEGLSNDELGVINKIAFSHEINECVNIGYNIGYNYLGEGDGDFSYSLAIGYSLTSKVGVYIEGYGEIVNLDKNFTNIDTGFTYLLKDNLQLDFSFGTGINHTMNYIALGISWNIRSESQK